MVASLLALPRGTRLADFAPLPDAEEANADGASSASDGARDPG